MTCKQYLIKNVEEHSITQEHFEEFLKNNFPGYKQHGVIKFLDNSLSRNYDIIELVENKNIYEQKNLGKIQLQYKPDETIVSVKSYRNPEGLVAKLMSKNSMTWIEKPEHFKHQ